MLSVLNDKALLSIATEAHSPRFKGLYLSQIILMYRWIICLEEQIAKQMIST